MDRDQEAGVRDQGTRGRRREAGVRDQEAGDGRQGSGIRDQESGARAKIHAKNLNAKRQRSKAAKGWL